jgi:fructosamine-3-kinase
MDRDPAWLNGWATALLGEQLAAMHHSRLCRGRSRLYGLEIHRLGSSLQPNHWEETVKFFGEERLMHQIGMAEKRGRLKPERRSRLEKLVGNLERWLYGVERQPGLVHGDLWSGNVLSGAGNQPVLIDPAVYYADREVEIAYTELFGGFERRFYQPPGRSATRRLDTLNGESFTTFTTC